MKLESGLQLERLEAAEAGRGAPLRNRARRHALDGGHDLPDVLRRRPAAAADDVHEPVARELTEEAARVLRQLVVLAERVRQPGVRIAGDPGRRGLGEVLHERPHLGAAEGAVDAHHERLRVLDRDPERLDGLPREVAAALVHGREGEPEGKLRRGVLRGDDRGLRVQRVEDGLDQEEVRATFAQRVHLLGVGLRHLVERRGAVGGIVHPRREGERHVERPDRAGHQPAELVGHLPRELRPLERHLGGDVLERVVGLADPRRREGVGGRDVGAGLEVRAVDVPHDVRLRQVEQVGVAGDVARVVAEALAAVLVLAAHALLDQHAPRAVEDGDALPEDRFEPFPCVLHLSPHSIGPGAALSGALGVC